MPDFCAAYGCSNRRNVKTRASGITFHTFPKNGKMRKLWELALRRDSFVATDRTLLCSEHFRSEDFDRTGQTVRLKDGVVPTIFNFPAHLQRLVATRNTTTSRRVEDNQPMDVSQDVPQPDVEEVGAAVDQLCLEAVDKILEIMEVNLATQEVTAGEAPPPPDDGCGSSTRTAVDKLCLEAVDKILEIMEVNVATREVTAGEAPPPPDDGCGSSTRTETEQGEKAAIAEAGRDHAYILLLISPAADAGNLLVALQSTGSAEGEKMPPHLPSSSPPASDDHGYARPSTAPPDGASAMEAGRRTQQPVQPPLQCSQCTKLFPSAERLADHHRKSHPLCSVCGTQFSGILKLREHEMKEHGLLPYSCSYCPKTFNHKTHRDLHEKARHTREKNCHCDICGRSFSCASVLKTHRLTHFNKTFICEVCGKTFYHASHLKRHTLVHQEVRPYSCSTCGRGFNQAANLRSHQATHSGERQLCSICGKSFRYLKNHVISKHPHEAAAGELPPRHAIISCPVCRKKFPNASQCRTHQLQHTGEKPFHCQACGKSYGRKAQLRAHAATHGGNKPYRCSVCAKTFSLASSFLRHRSIHSGATPYSCQACGKNFRLLTFLKAHLQTRRHLRRTQQNQDPTDQH